MAKPWADAGFDCYCVDVQHPKGERRDGHIIRVGTRSPLDAANALVRLCVRLPALHGPGCIGCALVRRKGLYALADAIGLFARAADLCNATGAPYGIENPVSTISSYWRKPDHTFDPCDFADYPGGESDTYTKRTCLWTGGGFVLPQKRRLDPVDGSRMHLMPPSSERANLRSATTPGFARAVFEANVRQRLRVAA